MSTSKTRRTPPRHPGSGVSDAFSIRSQRHANQIRIIVTSDHGHAQVLKQFKAPEPTAPGATSGSVAFSDALGAAFLHAAKAARRKAAQLNSGDT